MNEALLHALARAELEDIEGDDLLVAEDFFAPNESPGSHSDTLVEDE